MAAQNQYGLSDEKYNIWTSTQNVVFLDANGQPQDFSRWEQVASDWLVTAWGGDVDPTGIDLDIETGNYWQSTDANDWISIISHTTAASPPDHERVISTVGVLTYCRAKIVFTGGTNPTMTGWIKLNAVGIMPVT